jgi:hypothetical protein
MPPARTTKMQIQTMDQMMDAWEEQITDDQLPIGDAVEAKVLAQRQRDGQLAKCRRFPNCGDKPPCSFGYSRRSSGRKPGQTRWRFEAGKPDDGVGPRRH